MPVLRTSESDQDEEPRHRSIEMSVCLQDIEYCESVRISNGKSGKGQCSRARMMACGARFEEAKLVVSEKCLETQGQGLHRTYKKLSSIIRLQFTRDGFR